MSRRILEYLESSGKATTARARAVLKDMRPDGLLEQTIWSLIELHRESIDIVDVEDDITSLARLGEVFYYESIATKAEDCITIDCNGSRMLTIRGFVPPLIEIYHETTSYRPASFRPDGYPGTDAWFERISQQQWGIHE